MCVSASHNAVDILAPCGGQVEFDFGEMVLEFFEHIGQVIFHHELRCRDAQSARDVITHCMQ